MSTRSAHEAPLLCVNDLHMCIWMIWLYDLFYGLFVSSASFAGMESICTNSTWMVQSDQQHAVLNGCRCHFFRCRWSMMPSASILAFYISLALPKKHLPAMLRPAFSSLFEPKVAQNMKQQQLLLLLCVTFVQECIVIVVSPCQPQSIPCGKWCRRFVNLSMKVSSLPARRTGGSYNTPHINCMPCCHTNYKYIEKWSQAFSP